MPELPSKGGSWLANNVAKRQHDTIHQAISTTCLTMMLSGPTLLGNTRLTLFAILKFLKRDQIITDVEKRKEKLLEDTGLCRIED